MVGIFESNKKNNPKDQDNDQKNQGGQGGDHKNQGGQSGGQKNQGNQGGDQKNQSGQGGQSGSQKNQDNQNGHGGAAEIESYLKGMKFPANRDALIKQAKDNKAPQEIIRMLEQFEDQDYKSVTDISKAMSNKSK